MYTIDMLQGEGIPLRSRPGGIAFACLVLAVPVLAGIVAVSFYRTGEVVISIQEQQLGKLEAAVEQLWAAVEKKESLERERVQALALLSDVRAGLGGHIQWSPVLVSLVENLSDALTLTRLEARLDTVRCKVPAKDDPTRKTEVSVPARALRLCVGGRHREVSYEAVRNLQESLRSSPALGPMLDTITVSQSAGTLDGQEAVQYELNCAFKPMLQ
jgi:hypothetical protein